jgi:hypothetical protein
MQGMNRAIGIVFLILVITALGAVIFDSATGLGNTSIFGGAPTWVYTLIVLASSISLVKLLIPGR